jgi:protein-S-isoprenylcysteine O-methyltransferase Ste14
VLFVLYLALAVGARTALQLRWTGSSGHQHKRPSQMVEWISQILFAVALGLFLVAPVLDLTGPVEPVALDGRAAHAAGVVLYGLGLAGTLVAQVAMGRSWRIGVDDSETTELVITGPFALVRNPIFSATLLAFLGLTLMVPSVVAFVGFLGSGRVRTL